MKGPLCKVLVRKIKGDMDVEVSGTQIMLETLNGDAITFSSKTEGPGTDRDSVRIRCPQECVISLATHCKHLAKI